MSTKAAKNRINVTLKCEGKVRYLSVTEDQFNLLTYLIDEELLYDAKLIKEGTIVFEEI